MADTRTPTAPRGTSDRSSWTRAGELLDTSIPVASEALKAEIARALARFATTFGGQRAKRHGELLEEFAFAWAREGLRPDLVHEAASRVIASVKYFPRVSELIDAARAILRERRAEAAQSAAAAGGASLDVFYPHPPWENCPECGEDPVVHARWVPRTCRGEIAPETTLSPATRCRHGVHKKRAPDGGPGRHVEWRLAYEVTLPPPCACWDHLRRAGRVTVSTVDVGHLPERMVAAARALVGPAPDVPAGPTVPARWRDEPPPQPAGPVARRNEPQVAHG